MAKHSALTRDLLVRVQHPVPREIGVQGVVAEANSLGILVSTGYVPESEKVLPC